MPIILPPANFDDQKAAGVEINKVAQAAYDTSNPIWTKFAADPRKFLLDNKFTGPGGGPLPNVNFAYVVDTDNLLHVRIPPKGDINMGFNPADELSYGGEMSVFLCRYFIRHCR